MSDSLNKDFLKIKKSINSNLVKGLSRTEKDIEEDYYNGIISKEEYLKELEEI